MYKTKSSRGFAHLGLVIGIVVVVAAIAFGGWYVWDKNKDDDKKQSSNNSSQSNNQSQEKQPNVLVLANGAVQLTLPEDWPYIKGSPDYCYLPVTSDISSCEEAAIITPGAEQATQAGGPDYFGINVSVYDNPQRNNAQTWLEQDLDEGSASKTDTTSRASINGYDTYYLKKAYSGDGTSFEDVYYVFTAGDKAALIHARIYAPRTLNDGTQVGDHRQFESAIDEMANSIKFDLD